MIRQPRFARFVLPLLAEPVPAVLRRRTPRGCRSTPPGTPAGGLAGGVRRGGLHARESLSLVALQVQARVLVTRLGRDDFPRPPASPPPSRTTACSAISAWRQAFAWQALTGESAAADALRSDFP